MWPTALRKVAIRAVTILAVIWVMSIVILASALPIHAWLFHFENFKYISPIWGFHSEFDTMSGFQNFGFEMMLKI